MLENEVKKIPHIIHYCWFGKNPKPLIVVKCIESWKKYLPGYEIIEWNEENSDIDSLEYTREAYKARNWAYVSDYVRFIKLYEHGGVYFDTDVELLRSIPDEIMMNEAFTCVETTNDINPGLVFACCKGNAFVKEILDDYSNSKYEMKKNELTTVNIRVSKLMEKYGFEYSGKYQLINGIAIYPSEYFCGYDQDLHIKKITENTISVHHYASSWMTKSQQRKRQFQKVLKNIIGIKKYERIIKLKRSVFGISKT